MPVHSATIGYQADFKAVESKSNTLYLVLCRW